MERISTGVVGLDKLLQGGLPLGSMTLMFGPPGAGKSTLAKQFLYAGVVETKPCILIDTYETRDDSKEIMHSFGWDAELLNNLMFVDCYSWRLGKKPEGYSARVTELTEISIILRKIAETLGKASRVSRVVFDSFSDCVRSVNEENAAKFLEVLKARLAESQMTSLVILEEGIHSASLLATIEHISDGSIKMQVSEGGRFISITRMRATPAVLKWVPFEIARGIELHAMQLFK